MQTTTVTSGPWAWSEQAQTSSPSTTSTKRSALNPDWYRLGSARSSVAWLMVAVEQRRVMWPAGQGSSKVLKFGSSKVGGEGRTLNVERPTPNAEGGSGDWEVLTAEMKRYEYDIGPTGQVSYAAPGGYHDDCVMALALGVWGCHTFGVEPGRMMRLGEARRLRPEAVGRRTLTLA